MTTIIAFFVLRDFIAGYKGFCVRFTETESQLSMIECTGVRHSHVLFLINQIKLDNGRRVFTSEANLSTLCDSLNESLNLIMMNSINEADGTRLLEMVSDGKNEEDPGSQYRPILVKIVRNVKNQLNLVRQALTSMKKL